MFGPLSSPSGHRRTRGGFTLLELVVVLGIVVILAALGTTSLRELTPRMRARQGAMQLQKFIEEARALSMANNLETRICFDPDLGMDNDLEDGVDIGSYTVEMGHSSILSQEWDILPFEDNPGIDEYTGEGTIDISASGDHHLPHVAIAPFENELDGPGSNNNNCLVFGPRGMITNPASDFSNGSIDVKFVNTVASMNERDENFKVQIYRSGMVRLETNMNPKYSTTTISTAPINSSLSNE